MSRDKEVYKANMADVDFENTIEIIYGQLEKYKKVRK